MSFLSKLFKDPNKKYLEKIQPLVDKINGLEEEFKDIDLKEKTDQLKQRLSKESLDDILPEAFALTREASKRTLNQRHFDCQLIGGIVLHQGRIAEMKTGEGKTLTATLPLFLNALEEKGCHLVTVNDYLARRDCVWMGQIFYALGMSVACINHEQSFVYDPDYRKVEEEKDKIRDELGSFRVVEDYLKPCTREEAYRADITYGTNNEFGFDYLKDNMAHNLSDKKQRGFNYVIVDEIDSILIDEARTPLIISAPDSKSSNWYSEFARIMPKLDKKTDYELEEKSKSVTLTEEGVNKVERILGLENIYDSKGIKYVHHLEQALKAKVIFKRDKDYVVKDGKVVIVDQFTGRLMPGRRWSGGLHQAVEAKEGVFINPESVTLASITFQNLFRMYKKLSGMTGTALTSAEEFDKVYNLEVTPVPTNKEIKRVDSQDRIYKDYQAKYRAIIREIRERNKTGQPVLVGTTSIDKNEYLSKLLEREGVKHEVLNAKNHQREGEIIAQAGRLKSVTIATNMAGRGVDISLGGNPVIEEEAEKVREAGGLYIIGTERHEARRIDNQLRGRAGRQGDPGKTQFFVSLEDDLIRIFGGDKVKALFENFNLPEDEPIENKIISRSIESAQSKIEGMNFDARKHLLEYDDVLNKHREVVYKKRDEILEKSIDNTLKELILNIFKKLDLKDKYLEKEKEIGEENMRQINKTVALRTIDMLWIDHLENMEGLRDSVRLRAYGQRDPLVEYKREGRVLFQNLINTIEENMANTILKVRKVQKEEQVRNVAISGQTNRPKRNDPCPCGSGKKYKKCCGA